MWISYLGVFICVLSAYDVYEEKKTVLFTSPIILLGRAMWSEDNGSKKETIKKKIGAFSVAAGCLQFIKHNRKHSRVSNRRKRKC